MSPAVESARAAREQLKQALAQLQQPGLPASLDVVADPIAEAMGALHRIESGRGAPEVDGPAALGALRRALNLLQFQAEPHPAGDVAMERVADSLGLVHGIARSVAAAPAPAAAAPAPGQAPGVWKAPPMIPAAQPAPQAQAQARHVAAHAPTQVPEPEPVHGVWKAPPMIPVGHAGVHPHGTAPHPQAPHPQAPHHAPAPAPPSHGPQPAAAAVAGLWGLAAPAPHGAPAAPAVPIPPAVGAPPPHYYAAPPAQPKFDSRLMPLPGQAGSAGAAPAHAPAPAPSAPHRVLDLPPASGPVSSRSGHIRVELGANSESNFYRGLSGDDVFEAGGLFVATWQAPPVGATVLLLVTLPGGLQFEAEGVVRWVRDPDVESDAPPGFGAQLVAVNGNGHELVHRYVKNREPLFYDDL